MKKQINDLLLKMQNGENCIGETANQLLDLFAVSTRLFGVYDRNGNIKSVYREPYNAFEEATKLNSQLGKDEYFIDWVIVD